MARTHGPGAYRQTARLWARKLHNDAAYADTPTPASRSRQFVRASRREVAKEVLADTTAKFCRPDPFGNRLSRRRFVARERVRGRGFARYWKVFWEHAA